LRTLPAARVQRHDARRLPLKDSTIDVVITSPPYLNAIDYVRCSKFSLVWMGYRTSQLQTLRSTNIGSERGRRPQQKTNELESLVSAIGGNRLSVRDSGMLRGYIRDLDRVLSEVSRVLVPKGRAIFVVGDSTVRGTFVRNSEIINQLGKRHGLRLKKRTSRELPPSRRYLPPPTGKGTGAELAERMRREVIMNFVKQ
jgi:tRNA G10  N-methylase Trm11